LKHTDEGNEPEDLIGLKGGFDFGDKNNQRTTSEETAQDTQADTKSDPQTQRTNGPKERIPELTQRLLENREFRTMIDTKEVYYFNEGLGIFVKDGE
jgi:hypothetical protein